jgi:hypothetical protein
MGSGDGFDRQNPGDTTAMTEIRYIGKFDTEDSFTRAIRVRARIGGKDTDCDLPVDAIRMVYGLPPSTRDKDMPQCAIQMDGVADPVRVMNSHDAVTALLTEARKPWVIARLG